MRWRCWVVVISVLLAFWAQDGMALAASQQTGSVGSKLSRLFDWLGGGRGSGPRSATGSADVIHRAPQATGHPNGRAAGRAKGELPPASTPSGPDAPTGASATALRGFDAESSKRSAVKSGARFDYFDNADGTFTRRMAQGLVNYQDPAGRWQPIDTALSTAAGGRFRETANSLGVSFARLAGSAGQASTASFSALGSDSATQSDPAQSGPLATMTIPTEQAPESVSWTLSGANSVSASVSGSTAEYDGILPDTNLLLDAQPDGIKESLVLRSPSAPTTWVFPLSLTGLSLATGSDGTVDLVDGTGAVQAFLPAPYAFDAFVDPVSGEHHENWSVTYEITTVDGSPALRMSMDPQWLQDPALKFPVTVDPTMTVSTSGQTDTTYVEYPYAEDFSSEQVLKVGTYDGGAHIGQSFIKLPGLPTDNGYHITAAKLGLFDIWAATCGSSSSYQVYPIAGSWSVTGSKSWDNRPPTAAAIGTWTGTPSSGVCSNSSLNTGTGQWQYTTLSTAYFQNIAMGATANNGLSVFSSGTDSTAWKQFDSDHVSDHSPYVDLTYAPDQAPDITRTYPVSGFTSATLTPQLQAVVSDPDNWPNASVTLNFALYDPSGTQIASSGFGSSSHWDVPVGSLNWGQSYYWTVSAYDGWTTKTSGTQTFSTAVAQPLIASRLAQNSGHGYDEEAGNFTTSATDVKVASVGPPLQVDRAYNSLDVRTSGAFGAGWSSLPDMRVQPDDDGSGGVVVTDSDGRQQRFGRNSSELHQIAGVGDQTGDGVDDAVAVDQTTGKLWLYKGPDFSALTRVQVGNSGWNAMSWLTGADVTADGIGDVVAARASDGTLWLYTGKAGGGLSLGAKIGSSGWDAMTNLVLTPPLAGDGKKDLVAVETSTGKLWAYPVTSTGGLSTRYEIGTAGWNGMTELMGGDFNGDGRGDVVGVESATGNLWLYAGTGSSSLSTRVQIGSFWNSTQDLAPISGITGDATVDFLATQKSSGIRFLYHSGPSFGVGSSYAGNTKTATGMAVYTAALGQSGTLGPLPGSNAGWELLDSSGTTYTFGEAVDTAWKPTEVSDRYGRGETLTYDATGELEQIQNSVSHRSLYYSWTTPSAAGHPHVATVTTDEATDGDAGTAALWTYGYDGDRLTSVCPPSETSPAMASTSCYAYTYTDGSNYPAATLDAGPRSYWRLDDPAASAKAGSAVLANEQTDAGTATGVTFGSAAGPLHGSTASAATFSGAGYISPCPRHPCTRVRAAPCRCGSRPRPAESSSATRRSLSTGRPPPPERSHPCSTSAPTGSSTDTGGWPAAPEPRTSDRSPKSTTTSGTTPCCRRTAARRRCISTGPRRTRSPVPRTTRRTPSPTSAPASSRTG
jgi:hypothetical protein